MKKIKILHNLKLNIIIANAIYYFDRGFIKLNLMFDHKNCVQVKTGLSLRVLEHYNNGGDNNFSMQTYNLQNCLKN